MAIILFEYRLLLIASLSEIPVTTATSLCCIFWSSISLLFCLKDCKISAWHPYMYIIPIFSDILHHHTYTYNVLVLVCDHTTHPIFPSCVSTFFCLYQNFFGFNLSLLFIPQYVWSACTPVLCHQSSTMLYKINICSLWEIKYFYWMSLGNNFFFSSCSQIQLEILFYIFIKIYSVDQYCILPH